MSSMPAGHYYAEGDPPGTVRYWDGTQWVGDPIPAPPGTPPPPPGGAAAGADTERFASLGIRFGAAILDAVIGIIVAIVLVGIFVASDGDSFTDSSGSGAGILIGLLFYGVYVFIVARFGGTPGKLVLGLRITDEDGRTPVGYRGAIMRSIPQLLSNIPVLGVLISLGAAVASIFMINSDPERRSAYDRIGSTRVVRKDSL